MRGAPSRLRSETFRRERQESWHRLERLITRAERSGLQELTPEELNQLSTLQRAAMSSLSVARSISLDRNLLEYLESLAARAYFCVYGTKRSLRLALADFFARRFPRLVRTFRWHVLLAAFFMLLGTGVGFVQTTRDPSQFYNFVSAELAAGRDPHATTEFLREGLVPLFEAVRLPARCSAETDPRREGEKPDEPGTQDPDRGLHASSREGDLTDGRFALLQDQKCP